MPVDASLRMTILISEAVAAGIASQVLASYTKLPAIVFLLLFGIVLGPDGAGVLQPAVFGNGLETIISLSAALILFEGGLSFPLSNLQEVSTSLRNLFTIGVPITIGLGSIAAHWISEFPWAIAVLYAALMVITESAPILQQVKVEHRLATLLEGEEIFTEPIGSIVALLILHVVVSGDTEPFGLFEIGEGLLLRLGIGGALGMIGGGLLILGLRRAIALSQELKTLVVLATVWGLFSCAQVIDSESGLLTAVVIGIVLRTAALDEEDVLLQFNGQLSVLSNSVLFVLLAADISISSVVALGWRGIVTILALMLVVRPLNIVISTWNQDFSWQEKLFAAWAAPRGVTTISIASIFAISLAHQYIDGGEAIKGLVFMTVTLTVLFQGLTTGWVADWLSVRLDQAPVDQAPVDQAPVDQAPVDTDIETGSAESETPQRNTSETMGA